MGRETKILLGMLGLLSGVFVGVLSMKLLVPRPPAGAGPDVRVDRGADFAARELVEPPVPTPRPWDFTAAPPLVAAAPAAPAEMATSLEAAAAPAPAHADLAPVDPPRFASRFAPAPESFVPAADSAPAVPLDDRDEPDVEVQTDVAVTSAAWEPPAAPGQAPLLPDAPSFSATSDAAASADPPPPEDVPAGSHVVAPGESWWSLAERAYGDGRLYRALFAWNRARDTRVALAPGTRLEIPPRDRLAAAWPRLVPADSP